MKDFLPTLASTSLLRGRPALPTNREGVNPTHNQHFDFDSYLERNGLPPARRGTEGVKGLSRK